MSDDLEDLDVDVRTASIIWQEDEPPRLVLCGISEFEAIHLLRDAAYQLRMRVASVVIEGYEDEDDEDDDLDEV